MKSISEIIDNVIETEGGFVDHPDDAGGPTNFGITLKLYKTYKPRATVENLKNIKKADAHLIYYDEFFVKTKIEEIFKIAPNIGTELFDCAINMGPGTAVMMFQRCLNVLNRNGKDYADLPVNGVIGLSVISAMQSFINVRKAAGTVTMTKAFVCLRGARYIDIAERKPNNESFIYGWITNRIILGS